MSWGNHHSLILGRRQSWMSLKCLAWCCLKLGTNTWKPERTIMQVYASTLQETHETDLSLWLGRLVFPYLWQINNWLSMVILVACKIYLMLILLVYHGGLSLNFMLDFIPNQLLGDRFPQGSHGSSDSCSPHGEQPPISPDRGPGLHSDHCHGGWLILCSNGSS